MDGIRIRCAPLRLAVAVACAAAVAAAISVSGASAGLLGGGGGLLGSGAACSATFSTPFAQWYDYANYVAVQDGGFEGGGNGWKFSGGTAVVTGNESFNVAGADDSKSLVLTAGATATSKGLCFGTGYPNFRFFALATSGTPAIRVQVVYNGLLGVVGILDGGFVVPGNSWSPTTSQSLAFGNVAALLPLGTTSVSLKFSVSGGTAQLDDVFVDPVKEV